MCDQGHEIGLACVIPLVPTPTLVDCKYVNDVNIIISPNKELKAKATLETP